MYKVSLKATFSGKRAFGALFFALLAFLFALSTSARSEIYPQIDVSGYKKYSYNRLNVDKMQNIFQAQSLLGGYYAGSPWQESLRLGIVGKLTDKLSVSYDLEQQPDLPDKFDVKVKYDKTELTFGDFQANFTGNEFVSTSKFLNGVMITSHDNWYNTTFVPSAKLKSDTQALVSQAGNNSKGPYNLGHGSIVEGSERIELNNVLLSRNTDYTIDYFAGKITFTRILSVDDIFRYTYEFTNVIDLFFPTVSKRDFVGLQANIMVDPALLGVPQRKVERSIKRSTDYFPTMFPEPVKVETSNTKEAIYVPPQVTTDDTTEAEGSYMIYINSVPAILVHAASGEASADTKASIVAQKLETAISDKISTAEISVATMNDEEVVTVRGKAIITATKIEAQANKVSPRELALRWKNSIIAGLSAPTEALIHEETGLQVPEENEWESTGAYKLKNTPVIPYSEQITFMGKKLKKLEDYLIDYTDGSITLLIPSLPTPQEPLMIDYDFVDVAQESETLPGAGKGPYSLAHMNIIDGSETIYVNNIPYLRELDYKIDYMTGKIYFFTNIPQTANVVVRYKYLVMMAPPALTVSPVQKSMNLNVVYLKESGKKGATPPSISNTETFSGSTINSNNGAVYLQYRPVVSTSEVEVKKNGTVLNYGTDYVFPVYSATLGRITPETKLAYITDSDDTSDGLKTGTIKFLSPLLATEEVTVSYSYNKWSQDRYTGSGIVSQTRYYIGSYRNLVPGAEIVQIWRKNAINPAIKTIIRNSSVEVYDGHYSINYTDPPNIKFNSDPIIVDGETFYLNDINFTIIFKFVATASGAERPIAHDVIGVDSGFKVGDNFTITGSFARSKTDQVFTTVTTNEQFKGDASKRVFNMNSSAQIVDGSEQVYMNGQKLNRDDQYAFFYDINSAGKYGVLTFYTVTPASADAISVDYSYQSSSGTVTSVKEKQGNAYKLGGQIKPFSNLEIAADWKKVDNDFAPMGGISVPLGSDYRHLYLKTSPLPQLWSSLWLSQDIIESTVPIPNYTDKFLRSYDRNFAGGFNTFGLAQIDLGVRSFVTLDDKLPGSTLHNNDYQSDSYSMAISPRSLALGEFAFTNRNDAKKTISKTDTIDLNRPQDSTTDYFHTNNTFDFTRRVRLIVDYQLNKPYTSTYEAGTRTKGTLTENREINDLGTYLNWDLTFGNIKKLYAYVNVLGHNENDFILETKKSTINQTEHVDLVPIDQLSFGYDHNRQETPTITTAIGNPKAERWALSSRLTPYSTTILGWTGAWDDNLQESGSRTNGSAQTYTVDHVALTSTNYKLTTKYVLSSALRAGPLGVDPIVTTDTRSFSQGYDITYTPLSVLTLLTGFIQEDFSNKNDASVSPIDVKSQAQTTKVGTAYKASEDLDLSGNYSVKVTKTPGQAAHKTMLDARAVYMIFSQGTLNYDWSQEDNGGEILGGILVAQDFTKVIQSLSFNFVLPQNEQMILSSVVLRAAVKWANYLDRANSDNNFNATLLSFEGTLNF